MFRKLTLANIIKRDIAAAEVLAHDHEKAAEHHDALANMYSGRVGRLKADLGSLPEMPSRVSGTSASPQPSAAGDLSVSLEAFGKALTVARAAFFRKHAP